MKVNPLQNELHDLYLVNDLGIIEGFEREVCNTQNHPEWTDSGSWRVNVHH